MYSDNICHAHGKLTIWNEVADGFYDGVVDYNKYKNLHSEINTIKKYYHDTDKVSKLLSFGAIISLGKDFGNEKNLNMYDFLKPTPDNSKLHDECIFYSRDYQNSTLLQNKKENKNSIGIEIYKNFSLKKALLFSYNLFFCNGAVKTNYNLALIFNKQQIWSFVTIDDNLFSALKKPQTNIQNLLQTL